VSDRRPVAVAVHFPKRWVVAPAAQTRRTSAELAVAAPTGDAHRLLADPHDRERQALLPSAAGFDAG
jgi:hypothetical protein